MKTARTDRIFIQSGTRDELGGVDVAIANVYERDERPGVLSGVLVLPEEERIIAPGDEIELGTKRFVLEAIEKTATGAFEFVFVERGGQTRDASEKVHPVQISPLGARALANLLMELSGDVLGELGFDGTISQWIETSSDDIQRDWRGNETGPSTKYVFTAQFAPSGDAGKRLEAVMGLQYIRWSPQELSSTEVSGFWRHGEQTAHVFARARGHDPHCQINIAGTSGQIGQIGQMIALGAARITS